MSCPFRIMCINSIPASTHLADWNDLKLSIGLVTRLMARWSCSTMLLRYFTCRTMTGVSPRALISSMAALLAPLLSKVTFSGTPLAFMALSKNRRAAALSRLAVRRKSTRLAFLVYSTTKVFPDPFDLEVCFVHSPTDTNWPLVFTKDFFKGGQKPDRPAVDRRMVDEHASLLAIISSRWR